LRKTLRDEQLKKHRNIVLDAHNDELELKPEPEVELTIDDIKEGEFNFFFSISYWLNFFFANNFKLLYKYCVKV
jgi:hypothetical protein